MKEKSRKKVLVFMGPPGSGKGTQTDMLAERLKIPAISTGELLRLEMKNKSKIGEDIKHRMDSGQMIDDQIVRRIMEKRLRKPDTKNGFILDGFPRHAKQIADLEEILKEFHGEDKDVLVFFIYISASEVRRRLGHRRVCYNCGRTYHLDFTPPKKKDVCDSCGYKLERRKDDEPKFITRRMKIFHEDNDPMLNYFSSHNNLFRINGEQNIKKVQKDILRDLQKHAK